VLKCDSATAAEAVRALPFNHFRELRTENIKLTPHSVAARLPISMNEVATNAI